MRLYTRNLHLTSPPHTWVPGQSNQHSSHADSQSASAHNLPVLYIYPLIAPNKPVHTEPLSVTVPVVFGTCTVMVGTVVLIPVPSQYSAYLLMASGMFWNSFRNSSMVYGMQWLNKNTSAWFMKQINDLQHFKLVYRKVLGF